VREYHKCGGVFEGTEWGMRRLLWALETPGGAAGQRLKSGHN